MTLRKDTPVNHYSCTQEHGLARTACSEWNAEKTGHEASKVTVYARLPSQRAYILYTHMKCKIAVWILKQIFIAHMHYDMELYLRKKTSEGDGIGGPTCPLVAPRPPPLGWCLVVASTPSSHPLRSGGKQLLFPKEDVFNTGTAPRKSCGRPNPLRNAPAMRGQCSGCLGSCAAPRGGGSGKNFPAGFWEF